MEEVCRSEFGGLGMLRTKRGKEVSVLMCFLNAYISAHA